MATIKSYTDIEQSRKLAEILPLESADMHYGEYCVNGEHYPIPNCDDDYNGHCCWSLAALLNVLKDYTLQTVGCGNVFVVWESKEPVLSDTYDNPIDACVAMIEKLHESNLL